jgi:hypothetical protein
MNIATKLIGVIMGILAWVSAWGLMDLLVHDWSNRQKFWLYSVILGAICLSVWAHPTMLEYF